MTKPDQLRAGGSHARGSHHAVDPFDPPAPARRAPARIGAALVAAALGLSALDAAGCHLATGAGDLYVADGGADVFGSGSGGEGASSLGTGGSTTSSGSGGSTTSSGTGGGSCQPPLADCDGIAANGCESNTDSDLEHCGGCDLPCATSCQLGSCDVACDGDLAIDVQAPLQALRAMGLCSGVQAASWVLSDGSPPPASAPQSMNYHLGHGVLPDFGPNVHPQEGTRLLALSSGTARRPNDAGYASPQGFSKQYSGLQPPNFPQPLPSCPGVTLGAPFDAAAIQLTVSPPPGATGFSFKAKYYAYSWDAYVCSAYADPFLALLSPAPPSQPNANVAFDSLGNILGPYSELIEVCGCQSGPPCQAAGLSFACPLGTAELTGTGFEQHGASGWLETRVPIDPDTPITMRFVVHDSGDGVLDSTVLLDDWRWVDFSGTDPITTVVPNPL